MADADAQFHVNREVNEAISTLGERMAKIEALDCPALMYSLVAEFNKIEACGQKVEQTAYEIEKL